MAGLRQKEPRLARGSPPCVNYDAALSASAPIFVGIVSHRGLAVLALLTAAAFVAQVVLPLAGVVTLLPRAVRLLLLAGAGVGRVHLTLITVTVIGHVDLHGGLIPTIQT